MKNLALYLIIPAFLLVAFLFTPGLGYFAAQKEIDAREAARKAEIAKKQAEEEAKRAEIQKRAEADALARQKEREEEDRKKAEAKEKAYQDAIDKLNSDIAEYTKDADKYSSEVNAYELQLAKLRDKKEKLNSETFDLQKKVELAKIERRTAEMEVQRMVSMVADKLDTSPLMTPPPPPPAK